MRVGVNALSLREGGGGAVRYGAELLGALVAGHADEVALTVFVSRDAPAALRAAPWAGEVRWVQLPVGAGGQANALLQVGGLLAPAARHRVSVLHSLAGVAPPRLGPAMASVVTLLDVIWLLLPDQVSMTAAQRAGWVQKTRWAVRVATRVIAISEHGAQDIARAYGIDRARIDVTPLGARPVTTPALEGDVRARLGLGPGRLLLSVGQHQPYKGQAELLRALAQLDDDVVLALPGAPTDYTPTLHALAAELGVADRVHLLGFVDDADVEALYAAALAVVQPSRMEGFGLPALEALAHGKPLACSGRSALGEVVGDAALRFDPDDAPSIVDALRRLLDDAALRVQLAAGGPRRAAGFTWEATAAATVESYRRARGGR